MRFRTGTALTLIALVALPVAGCAAGSAVSDHGKVTAGRIGTNVQVEVAPGQRFSLAVDENASVGDSWRMEALPDVAVASFISDEYEHEGEPGTTGGGGTRYFVFNAKRPGTTAVTLSNCWRCAVDRVPADEQSRRLSGEATFRITVR
ncbi:chagasin family peptidase inhibitor I42 [Planomonospora sphaerica]|uniref:Chagasin family peptidase inhibitor I42 n=1 Tax=Planomonospora sphaerica TaxID=161355 RepID=A0A171B325_9ACTN|nr:protease inhibitor I42 family protein [Planomonospora sphaerica]GAT64608.1 chagasin family peptidase inhibitor I42 [Planomonospora sphaerica]